MSLRTVPIVSPQALVENRGARGLMPRDQELIRVLVESCVCKDCSEILHTGFLEPRKIANSQLLNITDEV